MANWSAAATAFVPYHDAIQNDMYSNSNGRVRFKDTKVGTIYLTSSVDESAADALYLHLNYQNAPGLRNPIQFFVGATLKRVNKITGNIADVVAISSEGKTGEDDKVQHIQSVQIPSGERPLKFTENYYYIVLEIRRDTTEKNPVAYGVRLTSS